MDYLLGRSTLDKYTSDTLNYCFSELSELVKGQQNVLPEGTMSIDRIVFYKDLLNTMQNAFKPITESHELASTLIPKVVQKLAFFPKHREQLRKHHEGAAWWIYIYDSHKKMIKNESLGNKLHNTFVSPFAERDRHPSYGLFSPNPFSIGSMKELQSHYIQDLKPIKETQGEGETAKNKKYWMKFLGTLETALAPLTSSKITTHLHIGEILRMLSQVPELAETLRNCHVASMVVFERFAEQEAEPVLESSSSALSERPSVDIASTQKTPSKHLVPTPMSSGRRKSEKMGLLGGGPSRLETQINSLGTMLETFINNQPKILEGLEGRVSEQVHTLADALKAPVNEAQLPELQESLKHLNALARQIEQEKSQRDGLQLTIPSLESLQQVVTSALGQVSQSHDALQQVLSEQIISLKGVQQDTQELKSLAALAIENGPLVARVDKLETAVTDLNANVLRVLQYLEQSKVLAEQGRVQESIKTIDTSLAQIVQQIGGLNLPVDANGPRFETIQTSLEKILVDIEALKPAENAFVELEEIQQEDPVLTRLTALEGLVKGISDSLTKARPRQNASNSSYQGQPNYQGQNERQGLVNHSHPPIDESCCVIL
ncbi:MAG: hypothetical protein Q8K75_08170 [Chlamydiales bacterium]|nr:hypothetical protein [Chlamydiales bacterium]